VLAAILGVFISGMSLWLLIVTTDLSDLGTVLGRADWALVGLAVGTLAASMLIRTARWKVILPTRAPGEPPSILRVLPVVLVGYAINTIVPMRLGDVFRGVAASRRFRLGTPEALGSVGLERVLDAGALAGVAALASMGSVVPAWLTQGGLIIAIAAAAVVIGVYLVGIAQRSNRFNPGKGTSVLWRAWRGLRANPRALAASSVLSAIAWAVDGMTVWIVARSLGIEIGWHDAMLIATGAALAAIIPSAPASIGTFHLAGTAVGVAMGLSATSALAVVVVWHATTVVSLLAAGGVSGVIIGAGMRDLRSRVERDTGVQTPLGTLP
jgi:uncharacterized membrane protein YbhN (UPF0104 family)